MSLSRQKPTNQLNDDVLVVIFDQLDEEDLLRCEAVCRQWRDVLISGTCWRRLFHRKIDSSPQWRQVWRDFGVNEKNLDVLKYRRICKDIIQELNEIDNNWRTGNFNVTSKGFYSAEFSIFTIGNDFIVHISCQDWSDEKQYVILHRTSLEVISSMKIPGGSFAVTNTNIVVLWDKENIKILDTNGQLISGVPELDEDERISWKLASCCLSGDQMAVLSENYGRVKLSLWDVSDPSNVICLKSGRFNLHQEELEDPSLIKMDEQFIAVSTFDDQYTTIYFFSKETLTLHWQKTVDGNSNENLAYDQGMLLVYGKFGLIEFYDVTSGQCFRKLRTQVKPNFLEPLGHLVGFNSKFMVVAQNSYNNNNNNNNTILSKMDVYDLEAVKNPKAARILVRTFIVKNYFEYFKVIESEIFCVNVHEIYRLNFSSFSVFRNEAKSVILSLPWRSVWRSKGVDDEPLEPVHHMEAYKEVLKYFEELSMNCHTAREYYSNLSNASICCELPKLKNHLYDERDDMEFDATDLLAYQISKTTYLSVMGNRIQLINRKTGKVITEVKLKRDVIDWHSNCNLLVCVHKIADREHLLRVWRIENFKKLTHIKYLTVDDYESLLQVDEQFIAIKSASQLTYKFISMKTFQVERSVSSRAKYFDYDKGYLFLLEDDHLARILDVASGTFLRDIRMEPSVSSKICINSNYVIVLTERYHHSMLYIYDLKCLKETDAEPTHLLLTSMKIKFKVKGMAMNEHKIVCVGFKKTCVIDLKPIDRLRCPNVINRLFLAVAE
jgi:F-box-like